MNKNTYVSELCRLCLKNDGEDDLFEKAGLVQDIFLCTGVKVAKSNNLPGKICKKCLETVINAKQLRLMVKENETNMKILFDHEDPTTVMDESSKENDTNSNSSDEDKTDDEELAVKGMKRQRSMSPENAPHVPKKISVRNDLFSPSKIANMKTEKDCTYIQGTKYGISKTSTMNNNNELDVTYTCAMCPKTFPTWKKVYCHQRMHNKKIECNECAKKFASKGDLEKHMRTHTGERPYVCDICDKSFSQRCTLKAHKETVHQVASESLVLYVKN